MTPSGIKATKRSFLWVWKTQKLWIYLLLSAVLVGLSAPSPSWAQQQDIKIHKLDNGLTLLTLSSNQAPLVYFNVNFFGGSLVETQDTDGLVHFLEHMLFKGNNFTPDSESYRRYTDQVGLVDNGTTGPNFMDYFGYFPSVFLEEVAELYASVAQSPKLLKEEVDKERTVVLDEYNRFLNYPQIKTYFAYQHILSGGRPHSSIAIGVTKKNIEQATSQTLRSVYNQIVAPQNTIITLVGDLTHAKGLEVVKKYFSQWQAPKGFKDVEVPKTPDYLQSTTRYNFSNPKNSNATIHLIYKGPTAQYQRADYLASVMLSKLLSHTGGKFHKKFIQSGKLFYGGSGGSSRVVHLPEMYIYASVKPDFVDKTIEELKEEVKLWVKPGYFDPQHIDDEIRDSVVKIKKDKDNFTELMKDITQTLRIYPPEFYTTRVQEYSAITLKDVQRVVKTYYIDKHHLVTVDYNSDDAEQLGVDLNGDRYFQKHLSPLIDVDSE